jgi:hypothetical protein
MGSLFCLILICLFEKSYNTKFYLTQKNCNDILKMSY